MRNRFVHLSCVLSFVCLTLLTGCWDAKEVATVSLVTGIAVDKGEKKKYRLTVEVLNAKELVGQKSMGDAPAILFHLEGNSLSEVARKMNIGITRKLVYSHMRTVVISEQLAKEGILDFLDFMERNREIRDDFNFVVTKNVKAYEVLGVTYAFQKLSSLKLHTQLNTASREFGIDPKIRLTDIISTLVSKGRHPVAASVTIQGSSNVRDGAKLKNMKSLVPKSIVVLSGMAVFRNDKLKGFLSTSDSRNYLWTQGKVDLTNITTKCSKKKNEVLDARIYNSGVKNKVTFKNGKPHISIHLRLEARLEGTQCGADLDTVETFKSYEKKLEQDVVATVKKTVQKVQRKYKVDIFGFGEDLHRQNKKKWHQIEKNWDQEFQQAEVEVTADITLRRTGIRTRSFLTEIKE